jgi:hypothetical protein
VDKLEHIQGAVAHHVYEEEGTWFIDLKQKLPPADQTKLTFRYQQEFSRYTGDHDERDALSQPVPSSRVAADIRAKDTN